MFFQRRIRETYKDLTEGENNDTLENFWANKYMQAIKDGKEEHSVLFVSKAGYPTNRKYFLEYFKYYIKSEQENSKKEILDVGCGFGDTLQFLSEKGFSCHGVDYTHGVIERAREKSKNRKIDFRVADVYNLPFENNVFDFVICKEVLQVISNPEKAINEFKRVLKKEGVLIIITLNAFSLDVFFQRDRIKRYNPYHLKEMMSQDNFGKFKIKGFYIFPKFMKFMSDIVITLKIYRFFNFFFFMFIFFAHNFYIKAEKQ